MTQSPSLPELPRLHRLKTDPEVYQAVLAGRKTFEIRLNDRDFRVGDELLLMETTATGEAIRAGAPLQFTGNEMRKRVSHVLSGYGLMPGWVCLSFACYEAGRAAAAQAVPKPVAWQHRASPQHPWHECSAAVAENRRKLGYEIRPLYAAFTQGAEVAAAQAVVGEASEPKTLRAELLALGYSEPQIDAMSDVKTMMKRAIDARAALTPSPTPTAPQEADALREVLQKIVDEHADGYGDAQAFARLARAALAQHQPQQGDQHV